MQTLFNSVAGGSPHITCPISGELLQLPVDAGCKLERGKKPHIFEYSNIKRVVEQKGRCPICNRKITLADLRVDSKKRREVSLTIELSIRYLTSRKPKKHSIDVLDKKHSFLENPDEIIGKIEAEDLDGPELDFISGLVRERIEWYNARIDITRRLLLDHLAQKIEELGEYQYFNFHRKLIRWSRAFEIKLPKLEKTSEMPESPPLVLDIKTNPKDPENPKKPLLDDDSKEKEEV